MADILIKGIGEPKNCDECLFLAHIGCDKVKCKLTGFEFYCWEIGWGDKNKPVKPWVRHKTCPIVPVPSHGDLIERKAICLTNFEIVMCDGDYKNGMKMLLEKIESAPTIIQASEG